MTRSKLAGLSESDLKFILNNKPDPNLLSAQELADKYDVSKRSIYNIWEKGALPTGGKTAPREKDPDKAMQKKMLNLMRQGKDPLAVADELMIVVRIVKKFQRRWLREGLLET